MHALKARPRPPLPAPRGPPRRHPAAALQRLLDRRLAHDRCPTSPATRSSSASTSRLTPAVLIPRPETETLVEHAIAFAARSPAALTIADVGCGSGAIAIALAVSLPDARVIATDISADALAVARRNAERHGAAARIDFREGDLLAPVPERVQVIAANLPYLTTAMWEQEYPEIHDHEPRDRPRRRPRRPPRHPPPPRRRAAAPHPRRRPLRRDRRVAGRRRRRSRAHRVSGRPRHRPPRPLRPRPRARGVFVAQSARRPKCAALCYGSSPTWSPFVSRCAPP